MHFRIDVANAVYRELLQERYKKHIKWLEDKDPLNRASTGYKSALTFMQSTDNSHLINDLFGKIEQMDIIRGEYVFDYIPELEWLNK